MHFLRLTDDRLNVLFEDEDIVAIDKAYGFNAHTNDSKNDHAEFIQDGMIEIFEKKLGQKLSVIHRLDQTTTGVMIFGKSVESAKKYAEYFFNRQVKKTYWFVTKNRSTQNKFFIEKPIIHKGKELDASTHLELLNKKNGFELWQANPHTGRNHQIRIHAQEAGLSIFGDGKYEGHDYPFLCLHNHKIEFPNGIVIFSRPPIYFENLEYFTDALLAKTLFEIDRRYRLYGKHFQELPLRWVHNQNNSLEPGFTLDSFGTFLEAYWYHEQFTDFDFKRFSKISEIYKKPIRIRLFHTKGEVIEVNSMKNQWSHGDVKLEPPLNQYLQRGWLLKNSENKNTLSLFAGSGFNATASLLGNAKNLTLVELSKVSLKLCRESFEANGFSQDQISDKIKFLNRDSYTFLEQCRNKKNQFDLVICDTPSFYRREKGLFKLEKEFARLAEHLLSILANDGRLLFSTSLDNIFVGDIERFFLMAQKKLNISQLKISNILPSMDFELPDEKSNLKSFLIERL